MKTAVFYYTQSGQALSVAKSICQPLAENNRVGLDRSVVSYKEIIPLQEYPFPWPKDVFFDTFPETRLGLPPSGIAPIDFSDIADADIVMVVGQSWFLSPSLPLQSFFADKQVQDYLKGRPVVFVNACRNMWYMTINSVKECLKTIGACLVGHIVLQDGAPNLVSVCTIVRWLINGKKNGNQLLPAAGISDADLLAASRFGTIIRNTLQNDDLAHLQDNLLAVGAIEYKPSIVYIEQVGHRMFGLWARFIRQKGDFRSKQRRFRVRLFYYYLVFVLFLVSPFAQLLFYLTYPLHRVSRKREAACRV